MFKRLFDLSHKKSKYHSANKTVNTLRILFQFQHLTEIQQNKWYQTRTLSSSSSWSVNLKESTSGNNLKLIELHCDFTKRKSSDTFTE
jgi:hypothetical protein